MATRSVQLPGRHRSLAAALRIALIRGALLLGGILLGGLLPNGPFPNSSVAWAQDASSLSAGASADIRAAIGRQIQAFRHDDAAAAFGLASPGIQAQFGTPQAFLEMVRERYRPVYRPRAYQFLQIEMVEGQPVQQVLLVGPDGAEVLAYYPMQQADDRSWRTDGCYLVPLHASQV